MNIFHIDILEGKLDTLSEQIIDLNTKYIEIMQKLLPIIS